MPPQFLFVIIRKFDVMSSKIVDRRRVFEFGNPRSEHAGSYIYRPEFISTCRVALYCEPVLQPNVISAYGHRYPTCVKTDVGNSVQTIRGYSAVSSIELTYIAIHQLPQRAENRFFLLKILNSGLVHFDF